MSDRPPFPDAERALGDLLADLGTCGTETPLTLQDGLPYIRLSRTGGTDDLVTDTATVSVDVFAADASSAKNTAALVRQRLIRGPLLADVSFATAHGLVDQVRTAIGPQMIPPTDSDNLRLCAASYTVHMRRTGG